MADEPSGDPEAPPRAIIWALAFAKLPMLLGIVAVFAVATALLVVGAVESGKLILGLVTPGGAAVDKDALLLSAIQLVDLVLLATVLHIMAVGLYELFIDSRIPVPPWLRITTIDDLKDKLIGVVVTVLAVTFLKQALAWDGKRDLLVYGVGIAAVVLALSYFLSIRPNKAK